MSQPTAKRMIDLGPVDERFPKAAYYAANGKKYKSLDFQDFNSLYPFTLQGNLPCGPGILFSRHGDKFQLVPMNVCDKKASKESLEWLRFEEARCPVPGTIIHNFYNTGERKVAGYFVDGYCEVKNVNGEIQKIVFEYNGKMKKQFLIHYKGII